MPVRSDSSGGRSAPPGERTQSTPGGQVGPVDDVHAHAAQRRGEPGDLGEQLAAPAADVDQRVQAALAHQPDQRRRQHRPQQGAALRGRGEVARRPPVLPVEAASGRTGRPATRRPRGSRARAARYVPGPRDSVSAVSTPEDRPARLRVGVVGAGRVGAVLGAALQRAGHRVVAVSGVSEASRTRAATLLPGVPVRTVEEVVAQAELVLLTVPDDDLAALVAGLTATRSWQAGQIVVHTSGSHGVGVFDAGAVAAHPRAGAAPGDDVHRHGDGPRPGWPTAASASRRRRCCARSPRRSSSRWAPSRSGSPRTTAPLYHAALAHGANHLVTLVAQAMQVLGSAGVGPAATACSPRCCRAALDNALRLGDAALTGPVARGDAGTVAAHLRELSDQTPDVRPTYVALARATAERALASGRLSAVRRRAAAGHPRRTQGALVTAPSTDAVPGTPTPSAPVVARTRAELRTARRALDRGDVAVVMTMGALHEGHAPADPARPAAGPSTWSSRSSSTRCSSAPGEDLSRYPRTFDTDLEICAREGVDLVFAADARRGLPRRRPRRAGLRRARSATCSRGRPAPGTSTAC